MTALVRRRPLLAYAALACALSWVWWIPLLVAGRPVRQGAGWPTQVPGLLGPALAAVVVTGLIEGRRGIGELLGRLARWRIGWRGSPAVASLLVVPAWALWHLPLFGLLATYRGFGPLTLVGFVVGLGCGSVVLGRVYGVAGGSVLATAVWHGTYNLGAGTAAGTGLLAAATTSAVMAWAVIVLIAAVRRRRSSTVNRVVLAVLRSPLHRMLGRGLLDLEVRGRRTGRLITLRSGP